MNEYNNQNPNNNNYQGYPPYPPMPQKNSSNVAIVVLLSVLCALILAAIVFCALYFGGVLTRPDTPANPNVEVASETVGNELPVIMYVANVKNSIYFRSTPEEIPSNIICEIPLNTPVIFISNEDAVFAKISYNNSEGYVKRSYLSTVIQNTGVQDNTVKYDMYVTNVDYAIYLRSSASEASDGNIICEIPLGTKVGYIETADSVFYKINYNGTIGYSKAVYLTPYKPSNQTRYMTVCNVKNSIYIRSTPSEANSNNILGEIPLGSVVRYISTPNSTFHYISWNGMYGYAKQIYLR